MANSLEPMSAPTTLAAVDSADALPDHRPCWVLGTCRVHRLERIGAAQKVGEVHASQAVGLKQAKQRPKRLNKGSQKAKGS